MNSFLITFKPATESPEYGWPIEELQKLAKRKSVGNLAGVEWRFSNCKDSSIGDRIFLLLQGKRGPAIIGYGKLAVCPDRTAEPPMAEITFDSLVDPTAEVLVSRDDLLAIDDAHGYWKTQRSGVKLPEVIAAKLESIVVGHLPQPKSNENALNPDWVRDELILALNLYLEHRLNPPGKGSREITKLSRILNRLGEKLFPPENRARTFRNENGVYMKLMNFRRLDPKYTVEGKKGLSRGAKAEEEVWSEFAGNPKRCQLVAKAIVASLDDGEIGANSYEPSMGEGIHEAAEGRLLTRKHLVRERNSALTKRKRHMAMSQSGKLACEVCGFDFVACYGDHGKGFMECHHTKPVHTLIEGHKTNVNDLALICSNCHRMIHRHRQWLTLDELRDHLKLQNI